MAVDLLKKRIIKYAEWEQEAKRRMEPHAFTYIQSGAGHEETLRANEEAFHRWKIRPRFLKDVSVRDLSIAFFGKKHPTPFFLAPIGMQGIAHPEGEKATARAAKQMNVPFITSSVSTYSLEEIAHESGDNTRWFQLYWSRDWEITASFVKRAEQAGYEAIVVTLDTALLGFRKSDLTHGYSPLKLGEGAGNYFSDPAFLSRLHESSEDNLEAALKELVNVVYEPTLSWEDLSFLRKQTNLPIILKGILHPEDARLALEYGMDGVIVSNHGGRQLDGCIAALDALEEVANAIRGKIPVLFDSGIRRGPDVIKAIALGADAVLVGRPYIYGLAADGQNGVEQALQNLQTDTDATLALSGLSSINDIKHDILVKNG
ncbi:alpha-hydroxy-acid oxidizing protein [Bacillus haimaensis]|uniref:alpha-hydroxy-acid oxidizing protein n=1 Tax=Bacillus haimaensis TaxID=3160967 RepID=UPI003AA90993